MQKFWQNMDSYWNHYWGKTLLQNGIFYPR